MEGNLLYSDFTDLNVNLIQKHPPSGHTKLTITNNINISKVNFKAKNITRIKANQQEVYNNPESIPNNID